MVAIHHDDLGKAVWRQRVVRKLELVALQSRSRHASAAALDLAAAACAYPQVSVQNPLVVQVEQERRVYTVVNLAASVGFGLRNTHANVPSAPVRANSVRAYIDSTNLRNQLAGVLAQQLILLDALLRD